MAASLFDSANYAKLFPVGDAGRLGTPQGKTGFVCPGLLRNSEN